MNADDLINNALNKGYKMLGGENFYVLEGNAEKNELRVLSLEELYKNNLRGFIFGEQSGFMVLGIFNSKDAAEEALIVIRTMMREDKDTRI